MFRESIDELEQMLLFKLDDIKAIIDKIDPDYNLVISQIKDKINYMATLYRESPKDYSAIYISFCQHLATFERLTNLINLTNNQNNFDGLQKAIETLADGILKYRAGITQQYLLTGLDTYYRYAITQPISLHSLEQGEKQLEGLMKPVRIFFEELIKPHPTFNKAMIHTVFKNIQPTPQIIAYFTLLGKFLEKNIHDVGILELSAANEIFNTMADQLDGLQKSSVLLSNLHQSKFDKQPSKRQKTYNAIPTVKTQMDNRKLPLLSAWQKISDDLKTVITLYSDTYCNWYSYNYNKKLPTYLCDKIDELICEKMYKLFLESPTDFPGLFEIFLQDIGAFSTQAKKYYENKEGSSLEKELIMFHQRMIRRHFQMKVYILYNNTICDNPFPAVINTNNWEHAFTSIIELLQITEENLKKNTTEDQKIKIENTLNKIKKLIDALQQLKNSIPTKHSSPAIACIKQCIIEFHSLYHNTPETLDLSPVVSEKIIDTINEMSDKLVSVLNGSLKNDIDYKTDRMKITVNPKPSSHNNSLSLFHERPSAKQLKSIAEHYGLICKNAAGNNDFFLAVALTLQHTRPDSDFASCTLSEAAVRLKKMVKEYSAKHLRDFQDTFPNHSLLMALGELLNLKIVVFNSDFSRPIINGKQNAADVICLGHEMTQRNSTYYQALLPADNSNKLPEKVVELINSQKYASDHPRQQNHGNRC